MNGRVWVAALAIVVGVADCGSSEPARSTGGRPPRLTAEADADWPDVRTRNSDCVVDYPKDLAERALAFDGTIESIDVGEHDDDAGATPVRLGVRLHEVFRGDLDEFVVIRTWDFMLSQHDVTGVRILAAVDLTLDLMGCGFTRPYSVKDAARWRAIYAKLPPEFCGTAVRDCDLDDSTPVPAGCNVASYEYAIERGIDAGYFPFDEIGCYGKYLSLRIDLGADACPPEATEEQRKQCARMKTAYFVARNSAWDLVTYEEQKSCSYVQSIEPSFPTRFCRPR
ncbi:MAG TPA: hypothetical protein VIG64_12825 [Actinomycetota bacterium]|jgi:hypothetical protein